MKFQAISILLMVALTAAQKTDYTGYKLYNIMLQDAEQLKYISNMEDNDPEVNINMKT